MITTTSLRPDPHDIPTRKLVIGIAIIALGALIYYVGILPSVHRHTRDVRATRRAACAVVPAATQAAIVAGFTDTGGREMRSLRAKPAGGGWMFVSADMARPSVPRGFTGELTTWRVRGDTTLQIESVDVNAHHFSSFPKAPKDVLVTDDGGLDSRWCAKNAALSPASRSEGRSGP